MTRALAGLALACCVALGCSAISGLGGIDFGEAGGGGGNAGGHASGGGGPAGGSGGRGDGGGNGGGRCDDQQKDGDETDVDCGGSCPPCAYGFACSTMRDCADAACTDGFCQNEPVGVWEELAQTSLATDRYGCSMGFDGKQIRMLDGLHGRSGGLSGGKTYLWDGTTWTSEATNPSAFAPRYEAVSVWNSSGMMIFGGQGNQSPLNDTWVLIANQDAWQSPFPGLAPSARAEAAASATSAGAVLFGGSAGNSELGDTWTFSGTQWTRVVPAHAPSSRAAAAMALDTRSDKPLLCGGSSSSQGGPLADCWLWDGSDWTPVSTATAPPARSGAIMVSDPVRGRIVLAAGSTGIAAYASDTWEWDGAGWTQIAASAPAVAQACASWDPNHRRVVFYGGLSSPTDVASSTFAYHARGNACIKDDGCDTGHCVDHVCCETASCGDGMRCNDAKSPGVCN